MPFMEDIHPPSGDEAVSDEHSVTPPEPSPRNRRDGFLVPSRATPHNPSPLPYSSETDSLHITVDGDTTIGTYDVRNFGWESAERTGFSQNDIIHFMIARVLTADYEISRSPALSRNPRLQPNLCFAIDRIRVSQGLPAHCTHNHRRSDVTVQEEQFAGLAEMIMFQLTGNDSSAEDTEAHSGHTLTIWLSSPEDGRDREAYLGLMRRLGPLPVPLPDRLEILLPEDAIDNPVYQEDSAYLL